MSLLAKIVQPSDEIAGVFFKYPGTKMETELVPIDRVERLKLMDRCRLPQVRGSRRQAEEFDEDKFNKIFAERVIKNIRNCDKEALERLLVLKPGELERLLGVEPGQKLTGEIKLDADDREYLYTHSLEYRLWIDDCLANADAINMALKAQSLGN
jgi:hypothetical protein